MAVPAAIGGIASLERLQRDINAGGHTMEVAESSTDFTFASVAMSAAWSRAASSVYGSRAW